MSLLCPILIYFSSNRIGFTMNLINDLKKLVLYMKNRIQENSYDSILWLVDIVPKISGFSYRKDKVSRTYRIFFQSEVANAET